MDHARVGLVSQRFKAYLTESMDQLARRPVLGVPGEMVEAGVQVLYENAPIKDADWHMLAARIYRAMSAAKKQESNPMKKRKGGKGRKC